MDKEAWSRVSKRRPAGVGWVGEKNTTQEITRDGVNEGRPNDTELALHESRTRI